MEQCRFCLEQEDPKKLISPCNCIGSQKYIHQVCLNKWQETMMKNVFTYPETFSLSQVSKCGVCKSKYITKPYSKYWKWIKFFTPFMSIVQQYSYSIILFLVVLALFSGLILITFLTNLLCILIVCVAICYWKGVRPRIFATIDGIRLGFIRVGNPVAEIMPGMIISATSAITQGIFMNSRILITNYSPEAGAVGFILNKQIGILYLDVEGNLVYGIGGPVSPNSQHIIHSMGDLPQSARVADGIYIGGVLNQINPEAKCRHFLGYSGWAPYQLDGEIRAGVWQIVGVATPDDVFI